MSHLRKAWGSRSADPGALLACAGPGGVGAARSRAELGQRGPGAVHEAEAPARRGSSRPPVG